MVLVEPLARGLARRTSTSRDVEVGRAGRAPGPAPGQLHQQAAASLRARPAFPVSEVSWRRITKPTSMSSCDPARGSPGWSQNTSTTTT